MTHNYEYNSTAVAADVMVARNAAAQGIRAVEGCTAQEPAGEHDPLRDFHDRTGVLGERFEDVREELGLGGWSALCPLCTNGEARRFFIERDCTIQSCEAGHDDAAITGSTRAHGPCGAEGPPPRPENDSLKNNAPLVGWPEWLPFGGPRELATFPVGLLPEWQGQIVGALAEQLQVPPDLLAMCVLSTLSAVCARRFWISPRKGWKQPALVWTLTMLPSGNRRTGAFDAATRPLRVFAERRGAELADQIATEESRLRILKGRQQRAEKIATEAKEPEARRVAEVEASELAREVAAFRVTTAPLMFVSEATAESAEQTCAEHGRLAVLADEPGLLGVLAGRYTKGAPPHLDPFLKGYEGDTIHVSRMKSKDGAGGNRYAPAAHVTIGLAPQPDVALPLLRSSGAFAASGFLWRFLFSMPRSWVGYRNVRAPAASAEVIAAYEERIAEMLAMPEPAFDATENQIPVLFATSEATEDLMVFCEKLEPRLHPDTGDLAALGSWGSKLASQIVRLAGLLHASEHRCRPWETAIALSTMKRAVAMADYFIAHAKAARFELGADPDAKRAQRAVEWIRRRLKKGENHFTRSELHKAIAKNHTLTEIDKPLNRLLALLTGHGAVRHATATSTGGRPKKDTFEVRPNLLEVSDVE